MPTRNVSLTKELDSYVEQSVRSGHYDNASEVIRAAIRALMQADLEDQAKVEALAEMRELIRQRAEANERKSKVA
jgi:antitoxin ParD1/3/4